MKHKKHKRIPRSAERGQGALPLDPAAFEKAGETFKRALCAQGGAKL